MSEQIKDKLDPESIKIMAHRGVARLGQVKWRQVMQLIEVIRRYSEDLDSLAKSIRGGEITSEEETEEQHHTALHYANTYEYWAECLLMTASLLVREVDSNPARYMGIGIDNWTGLKDIDGDNLNFGDIAELPTDEKEGIRLLFVIKFIQNEFYSKIAKVSGDTNTDLGKEAAAKLKRIGPSSEHPELMKIIRGED